MTRATIADDARLAAVGTSLACSTRPQPPASTLEIDSGIGIFRPDMSADRWMRDTFIVPDGVLHNPDHQHLIDARIGVVWTNTPFRRNQRWLVGMAECPNTTGGAWKKGRATQQLVEWFGLEPDFVITLYAPTLGKVSDRDFCAIIEHELYHCAQATTDLGAPRFHHDGRPIYGILGHDVEEFVGVVRRYGAVGTTRELADAAARSPIVTDDALAIACATCAGVNR